MDCARIGLGLLLLTSGCFSPNEQSLAGTDGDGTADETTATGATTPTMTSGPTDPTPGTDPTGTNPTDTDPSATDPSDTDPSDTDPSDTDPSDTDPSDTDPTDTGGPNCGDANEDPDEECDDGNDVDGDGCNNNCVVSGSVLWSASYDEADDLATSLAIDGDDNVLVLALVQTAGSSERFSNWQRTYDAGGNATSTSTPPEDILSIAQKLGGEGFVAAFDADSSNGDEGTGWTVAIGGFSSSGDMQWSQLLGGRQYVGRISARPEQGAAIGGGLNTSTSGIFGYGHEGFLAAHDGSGSEEWRQEEDGGLSGCGATAVAPDGTVTVACYNSGDDPDIRLEKYGPGGVLAWSQPIPAASSIRWLNQSFSYQSLEDLVEPGLAVNASGQIVFCLENLVVALDQNGGTVWTEDATGAGNMTLRDASIADDGAVIVVGHDASDGGNDGNDIVVRKFDAAGGEQWSDKVDADGFDDSASEVELASDGIVVYGVTASGVDDRDLWLRKYAW